MNSEKAILVPSFAWTTVFDSGLQVYNQNGRNEIVVYGEDGAISLSSAGQWSVRKVPTEEETT